MKYSILKLKYYLILLLSLLVFAVIGVYAKPYVSSALIKIGLLNPERQVDYRNTSVNLSFRTADNGILELPKHRGKMVIINFWAAWCPTCREEMPSMNALYEKLSSNPDVLFFTVDKDEDPSSARKYMKMMSYKFPVVREIVKTPKSIFPGELPTTVILNKEGKIVYKHSGKTDFNEPEFVAIIERILDSKEDTKGEEL